MNGISGSESIFAGAAVFVEISFTGAVAVEKCLATVVVVVLGSEVSRDK